MLKYHGFGVFKILIIMQLTGNDTNQRPHELLKTNNRVKSVFSMFQFHWKNLVDFTIRFLRFER